MWKISILILTFSVILIIILNCIEPSNKPKYIMKWHYIGVVDDVRIFNVWDALDGYQKSISIRIDNRVIALSGDYIIKNEPRIGYKAYITKDFFRKIKFISNK